MITFEHANPQCTGTQLVVDMKPAVGSDDGTFTFQIRCQATVRIEHDDLSHSPPEFDDDGSVLASINANQAAHLLLVLEGKVDNVCGGKGLYDNSLRYVSLLHCDHDRARRVFVLHIIMRPTDTTEGEKRDLRIFLNPTEATALARAINSSMGRVAFGD